MSDSLTDARLREMRVTLAALVGGLDVIRSDILRVIDEVLTVRARAGQEWEPARAPSEPAAVQRAERALDRQREYYDRLREERDETEHVIACCADKVNSWARELGLDECERPYAGFALRARMPMEPDSETASPLG